MKNHSVLQERLQAKLPSSLGLYIHIPFCRERCQFCAFYVKPHYHEYVEAFLNGLAQEIDAYGELYGLNAIPVTSVYFGGGTPTALSAKQLVMVLDNIERIFRVSPEAELSIEAHPGTINFENLAVLYSRGFNRLSIGAQSFDDRELRQLGGRSESQTTEKAFELARQVGFKNINLDLMYGFPEHTLYSWEETLDYTINLNPTHVSCYAFTVEEGSYFYEKVLAREVHRPEEALQNDLGKFTVIILERKGYEQYEISNFCQSGFSCQHNLRYWTSEAYLGLGPSAQSYLSGVRFGNVGDLNSYCEILASGGLPFDNLEPLSIQEIQKERIVFGLRMRKGVSVEQVRLFSEQNYSWGQSLITLENQGFIAEEEGHIRLTAKGIQFADSVSVALI